MRTPNIGTQNDPFVIPADPAAQKQMINFLGSTVGRVQDPSAKVYVKTPTGDVRIVSPAQLMNMQASQQ
jgi:hypothetical protein